MIFHDTHLADVRLIELEPRGDDRGFFARAWCRRELEAAGLDTSFAQANMSGSVHTGTLRGLHFQRPPFSEVKLVRCVRGAILDVIVDIRVGSPTYLQWGGFELSADNRRSLYVPQGFAHGFQSLTDDVELYYQVSEYYSPEHEFGLRFDDPALGIDWPRPVTVMSEKDQSWPDFTSDVDFGFRYAASTEDSE